MNGSHDLLAGLDDIDWAALGHAYGSAEDVPGELRAACGEDEKARERAFERLFNSICHQGTRYSASPFAALFLARIAAQGPADARIEALMLLLRLAVDWHDTYDLPLGIDTVTWRAEAVSPEENLRWYDEQIAAESDEARLEKLRQGREYCAAGHPIDAREGALRSYDAVRAQLPALLPLLEDPDPEVRSRLAYLLGWFPEEAGTVAGALRRRLEAERDPVITATLVIATGLLTDHDGDGRIALRLDDAEPLVRWAAATALARHLILCPGPIGAAGPGARLAERVLDELAAFGARPAPQPSTLHHQRDPHSYTVETLVSLMKNTEHTDKILRAIITALPRVKETGVVPRPLASRAERVLTALFTPTDTPLTFDELSPGRQEFLTALADLLSADDYQPYFFGSSMHETLTPLGLPGTRPALRAFVGLDTEGEDPTASLPDPMAKYR
ncbi:hypothetical protein ACIRVF_41455 [Kitasatospora sp. NPDC101157]|uniref:hypothetical protein n=1 Tax=Kitasatospora sp. NPDC101157 TaxID=3364098 RepID=UPI00382A0D27